MLTPMRPGSIEEVSVTCWLRESLARLTKLRLEDLMPGIALHVVGRLKWNIYRHGRSHDYHVIRSYLIKVPNPGDVVLA